MTDYTMILIFLSALILINALTAMCVLVTTKDLHHKIDRLSPTPTQHGQHDPSMLSLPNDPSQVSPNHATSVPEPNLRTANKERQPNQ